jgi:hypothetical protein
MKMQTSKISLSTIPTNVPTRFLCCEGKASTKKGKPWIMQMDLHKPMTNMHPYRSILVLETSSKVQKDKVRNTFLTWMCWTRVA